MKDLPFVRRSSVFFSIVLALAAGAGSGLLATCGPFTDAAADSFCPFVLEIFYLGITTGTTPTTYDPTANVSRLQMAAFLSRTVDGALRRGSRRAALDQFWTTKNSTVMGLTTVGLDPILLASDGADIWVTNHGDDTVSRVRASDGKLLETWTGATRGWAVLPAMGKVFVTGDTDPGRLYRIDPSATAGAVTTVASNLGVNVEGIAFDGTRIWVTSISSHSVSIVTPGPTIPWTATTVTAGFNSADGVVFDGSNIWIVDNTFLRKLDSSGAVLQTVTLGGSPSGGGQPVFDGSNIWVPLASISGISVVRASSGAVLATLTGNGLGDADSAAFDGQRVAVTSDNSATLSLWKAADLTPISSVSLPTTHPRGVCSDGINFWVVLDLGHSILRF